ncbi:hypothetical protein KC315_g4848 [Hortaea werneckii]|nr:hypothetical protein KC315_g4848 [Hortaea werneckii]
MAFLRALIIVASLVLSVFSTTPIAARISVRANKVPDKLHCFNACYGVNRTIVEQTIHSFCATYDGVYLNKDGPAGTFRGIFADQEYTPKPNTAEKGKIHMQMLAQDDESCGTQIVPYSVCSDNFWVTINQCNCCKEDGKQGGIWHTPCLLFIYSPGWNGCMGS